MCREVAAESAGVMRWRPFLSCQVWRPVLCGARGFFTIHAVVFIQPGGEA